MVFFYGVYAINSKIFSSVGIANPISKVTRSFSEYAKILGGEVNE